MLADQMRQHLKAHGLLQTTGEPQMKIETRKIQNGNWGLVIDGKTVETGFRTRDAARSKGRALVKQEKKEFERAPGPPKPEPEPEPEPVTDYGMHSLIIRVRGTSDQFLRRVQANAKNPVAAYHVVDSLAKARIYKTQTWAFKALSEAKSNRPDLELELHPVSPEAITHAIENDKSIDRVWYIAFKDGWIRKDQAKVAGEPRSYRHVDVVEKATVYRTRRWAEKTLTRVVSEFPKFEGARVVVGAK